MMSGIKIYTVHIKPGTPAAGERPVFVKEGFNFYALIFTVLWALYQRLWLVALFIVAVNIAFGALAQSQLFAPASVGAMQFGFQLLIGWHGNDWIRSRLSRQGYIMADIAAANSMLGAEQRYFERHLAAA